MLTHLGRRVYLRVKGAAGAMLGSKPGVPALAPIPDGARRRVAIIGAGLAGLSAACQLEEAGNSVTVFEARSRPGGRAFTLRAGFEDDVYADAGPARIRDDHELVLALSQRLGLETAPFYPDRGDLGVYQGDECVARISAARRFLRKSALARMPARMQRLLHVYSDLAGELGLPAGSRIWDQPILRKIRGGTDRLPLALAARYRGRIRYDTAVVRVSQLSDSAEVTTTCRGVTMTERVHEVICTVPASVLHQIEFSPSLTPTKRSALAALRYGPAVRVFLQMDHRPWEALGLNGFGLSDQLGELWSPLFDDPLRGTLLTTHAKGALADDLGAMDPDDRIHRAIGQLDRLIGGVKGHVRRAATISWEDAEWSRGGWPAFRDGFDRRAQEAIRAELRRPEGRIHFAGDYTATTHFAWMEGAIESGYRAAAEVHGTPLRVSTEVKLATIEMLEGAHDRQSAVSGSPNR